MQKIVDALAKKQGVNPDQVKMEFDGDVIKGDETCLRLEIEDDDILDIRI